MPICPDSEDAVVRARLRLYHRGRPCGPDAIRHYLTHHGELAPVPSRSTIHRLLTLYGLTHGRTGWYHEDWPVWVPWSAWVPPHQRRYPDWDLDDLW
jgi:hypothetical protein